MLDHDAIAKQLGAALTFDNSTGTHTIRAQTEKIAEHRGCGCWWLYLAAQPIIAPCQEHLKKLET